MIKKIVAVSLVLLAAAGGYFLGYDHGWEKAADYLERGNDEAKGEESEKINVRDLNIKVGDKISSPLTVTGRARGTWFFEASFPLILTDWDGLIIAQSHAQARGEWMTEDFVPFEGKIEFAKPNYKNNGALILRKDNPSGLPEHDDAVEIPIYYQ